MDGPDGLGYATRDGRVPKLVVVAIVWAVFGLVGLFAALLLRSGGFAVFGGLCVVAGGALYFVQRTRDQLAHDEMHLDADPFSPASGGDLIDEDEAEPDDDAAPTSAFGRPDRDEDILDAEFTEYFDYDQSPADQDDGTGYDDEEVAYQRYQSDQRTRESEAAEHRDADDEDDWSDTDSRDDDVARTSRIPNRGGGDEDDDEDDDDLGTREYGSRR